MPRDLISRRRPKVLTPVRPNVGIQAAYRSKLDQLIEDMQRSVMRWVMATLRANEPEIIALAQDASPAVEARNMIRKLTQRWQSRFDKAAPELAKYFATAVNKRSDANLRNILKRGGFSVDFKMTAAMNDAMQATIGEQVGLIKSIPQQYLTDVQGMVMRSVACGRDLGELAEEIEHRYALTKKRAALISRDQNNKATATLTRVRQLSLGIERARWVHSGGGKTPRPTHVAASRDKVTYDIREGWYDPDEGRHIFPGELINCRCVAAAVIPGLDL